MASSIKQQLLGALGKIDRPGSFCASGRLPAVLPGLEVEGFGPVAFPLGQHHAAALKKRAHQAPYGKGEQTLVDTDVRRVWEIDAEQVTFAMARQLRSGPSRSLRRGHPSMRGTARLLL